MYATVTDMIARFGEVQIVRLSNTEDREAETPNVEKVNTALIDATELINGYIRGRYLTSEGMTKDRAEVIKWLENIAKEIVHLDIQLASPTGGNAVGSGPRISDRERIVTFDTLRGF